MVLLVEVKGVGGRQHVAHVQREVMRPRTEEDDRKAEKAVANDCYCPQSLLLHTEDKVVGCDCKDPEYLPAAREDREYRGEGSCGNPYRRLVDLDTDFLEDHLPIYRQCLPSPTEVLSMETEEMDSE